VDITFLFRSDMMIHLFLFVLPHSSTFAYFLCLALLGFYDTTRKTDFHVHTHTHIYPTDIITTQLNVHLLLAVYDTTFMHQHLSSNYVASTLLHAFFVFMQSQLSGSQLSGFPAVGFSFQ